jgi:hypothetical protein
MKFSIFAHGCPYSIKAVMTMFGCSTTFGVFSGLGGAGTKLMAPTREEERMLLQPVALEQVPSVTIMNKKARRPHPAPVHSTSAVNRQHTAHRTDTGVPPPATEGQPHHPLEESRPLLCRDHCLPWPSRRFSGSVSGSRSADPDASQGPPCRWSRACSREMGSDF